jgi:hypothetical protein
LVFQICICHPLIRFIPPYYLFFVYCPASQRNTSTLLVEMKIIATSMENSMNIPAYSFNGYFFKFSGY